MVLVWDFISIPKVHTCVIFTECLESLGLLIQNNGLSVCGGTPQKVVPLIASQISDRDNAVRSSALNTLVVVYGNVGDQVYNLVGQVRQYHGVLLSVGHPPPSPLSLLRRI